MAGYGIGTSFQPGADQNGQGRRATPVQEAIRLLSLRLPSRVSPSAIAPQALLQSPGGAGLSGGGMTTDAVLELLRRLRMQSGAALPPQAQPFMQTPSAAQSVFTVPSAQDDRERGISRALPQPPRVLPGSPPPGPPPPGPPPAAPPPPPNIVPGFIDRPRDPVQDPGPTTSADSSPYGDLVNWLPPRGTPYDPEY